MNMMRHLYLTLSLAMLSGCAQYGANYPGGFNGSYGPDFDQLYGFEANMAQSSGAARAEICGSLLKSHGASPSPDLVLHLLAGRLFSDACGDVAWLIDRAAAIPPGALNDDRLQRFVVIHTEALKRQRGPRRGVGQDCAAKAQPNAPKSGANKEDAKALKEKLDAIRSIEKRLDENSSDEN